MIVLGTACAALAAGCGQSAPHLYSLGKTKACLATKPVRLGGALDFVASTSTGGAVKIHTSRNFATLVFGRTAADADNVAAAYHRFAAKNVGVSDVLDQNQNAVLLWHLHPSQSDLDLVEGCLR